MKNLFSLLFLVSLAIVLPKYSLSQTGISYGVYLSPDLGYRVPNFAKGDKETLQLLGRVYQPGISYSAGAFMRINKNSQMYFDFGVRVANRLEARTAKRQLVYNGPPDPLAPDFAKTKYLHRYVEIPVNAGFLLTSKRNVSLWLTAGLSGGYRFSSVNWAKLYYSDRTEISRSNPGGNSLREVSLMAQAGVSVEIELSENLLLRLNPEIRQAFISINSPNVSNPGIPFYLGSFGINTGLVFGK